MAGTAGLGPGSRVAGRYTLERELGRGGMGAVFVARDDKFTARVALKLSDAGDPAGHEAFAARFRREAEIGHRLGRVEGFVRALDWGAIEGTTCLYLVMDLVDGARPLDLTGGARHDRLERLRRAARLVAEAHRQGVIHRDLKPANILQRKDGAVLLTDFGLAKVQGESPAAELDASLTQLTQTGVGMGTSLFMPPEQFEDAGTVDARADVFALGVMLFMALTGKAPFPGQTFQSVWLKQQKVLEGKEPAPRPAQLDPSVPAALDDLCARALELRVEQRLPTAAALVAGLDAHLALTPLGQAPLLGDLSTTGAAQPGSQLASGLAIGTSRAAAGAGSSTIAEAPEPSGRSSLPPARAAAGSTVDERTLPCSPSDAGPRPAPAGSTVDERTLPWSPSDAGPRPAPAGAASTVDERTRPWSPDDSGPSTPPPQRRPGLRPADATTRGEARTVAPRSSRRMLAATAKGSACGPLVASALLLAVLAAGSAWLAWRRFGRPRPAPLLLVLDAPADGAVVGASYTVRGRVEGWTTRESRAERRVAVRLLDTSMSGMGDVQDDGRFSFTVDTGSYPDGDCLVDIGLASGGSRLVNEPAPLGRGLYVDRVPPGIEVLAPVDGLRTGDARPALKLRVGDDSGKPVAVTIVVNDGTTSQRLERRVEQSGDLDVPFDLAFGTTTLEVTAADEVGHVTSARRVVHRAALAARLNVLAWTGSAAADLAELEDGTEVRPGLRAKVVIETQEPAFQYVVQRFPDGRAQVHLPRGTKPVAYPPSVRKVPNRPTESIDLACPPGGEGQLVVVLSRAAVPALDALAARLGVDPGAAPELDLALAALPAGAWRLDEKVRAPWNDLTTYPVGHVTADADTLVRVVRYRAR